MKAPIVSTPALGAAISCAMTAADFVRTAKELGGKPEKASILSAIA